MIGRTLALLAKPHRAFLDRASETRLANETIKSVQIRTSSVFRQVKNAAIDNKKVSCRRS